MIKSITEQRDSQLFRIIIQTKTGINWYAGRPRQIKICHKLSSGKKKPSPQQPVYQIIKISAAALQLFCQYVADLGKTKQKNFQGSDCQPVQMTDWLWNKPKAHSMCYQGLATFVTLEGVWGCRPGQMATINKISSDLTMMTLKSQGYRSPLLTLRQNNWQYQSSVPLVSYVHTQMSESVSHGEQSFLKM